MTETLAGRCVECQSPASHGVYCETHFRELLADPGQPVSPSLTFSEDILHGPVGALVLALDAQTEAPMPFLWMDLLTTFGCAVGPSPHIYVGTRQPLKLFSMLVGPTGAGRKGTTRSIVSDVFEEICPDLKVMYGISSGEGLIEAVADPYPNKKGELTGGTVDKRLLVVDEEFSRTHTVAHRSGSAVGPVLRQAWDWKNLENPKTEARRATKPHICSIVHCTGEELSHIASFVDVHSGFLNRYAMVWGERTKKLPHASRPTGRAIADEISALRRSLPECRKIPQFEWSTSAGALWEEIYEKDVLQSGVVGALTQRKLPYIARIAAVLSGTVASRVISLEALKSAYLTWQYVAASTAHIVNTYNLGSSRAVEKGIEMAESRLVSQKVEKLLQALASASYNGLTRSQITVDVFRKNVSSSEIDALVAKLVSEGLVVREQTKGRGGRSGVTETVWLLGFRRPAG